jgi:hypothetical protein
MGQNDFVALMAIAPLMVGIILLGAVILKSVRKPKLTATDLHNLEVAELKRAKKTQKKVRNQILKQMAEDEKRIDAI